MGGYIMQVQNFSVNDGEGIRTTIFLAGCPLRCAWCANPEGRTSENALTHWVETEEVLKVIRHQTVFYRFSGGGVTFSGGEATVQREFLAEMVDALYDEGYNLALETCGFFNFDQLLPTLKKMNMIFMDLKHLDARQHEKFTGVNNTLILKNLLKTAELDIPLVVRIPTIVGVNGNDEDMEKMFVYLRKNIPKAAVELLPYHRYGEEKYRQLGLAIPGEGFQIPSEEKMLAWRKLACNLGLNMVSFK